MRKGRGGASLQIFRHPKGGLEGAPKICILQNQQKEGGGLLKIELLARGVEKTSSLKPPPPPLVILNELSLKQGVS